MSLRISTQFNPCLNTLLLNAPSENFPFWLGHAGMVGLLLDFLGAERDAKYDHAYDHLKYYKWGTIHYINMIHLSTTYPDLHNAYLRGFHTVSRIKIPKKFYIDIALDTKTKEGTLLLIFNHEKTK